VGIEAVEDLAADLAAALQRAAAPRAVAFAI
jgi:cystathionine beta-lyase/cystathionine gamma-synthase